MRRAFAISSACLLLLVGPTTGHAEDRPAAAGTRCELAAFPPPRPAAPALGGWRAVAYRALKWLDKAETPEAALARLGGTRLTMRADRDMFRAAVLNDLRNDTRCLMREARIGYGGLAVRDGSVELQLREGANAGHALAALAAATGSAVDVVQMDDGAIKLTPSEKGYGDRLAAMLDRAVEIIAGRAKDLGLAQVGVARDGLDRVLIRLPGVADASRLVTMLASRARLELRLIDTTIPAEEALKSKIPLDDDLLYGMKDKVPFLVSKKVAVGGEDIVEVHAGLPDNGQPYVGFRFDARGSQDFARVTRDNVGTPFAIVLDDQVISAPVIREPILGGSGQISGNFTVQEAHDLAILLRSGALPVRFEVVERQAVKPETN